ncbi:helix-turn-helix transcriptional regulator [Mesorhizobium xinjiangense]|uniref:helix-turn-helix transcriptional regulator n=1 Tax=Mesorhizobium xinjiangense TaxID=2678685 RepID=UPI001F1AA10A|nr:autoinducer binding domain-containing protein [Mesorhizobium xinjiangense]
MKPLLDDLLHVVSQLGFYHLILSGVPVRGQKLDQLVELNGWPEDWYRRYLERDYASVDSVCAYSAVSHAPFHWKDIPQLYSGTRESIRVSGEAAEFGIVSGFAVPFVSFRYWQSVVSFASPWKDCTLSARQKAQIVTIATFAGGAVEALTFSDGRKERVELSDRERDILLWLAEGKSAWEIGEILGIAEVTVKWHSRRIREKFGVATTVQAVVEAIRCRAILP